MLIPDAREAIRSSTVNSFICLQHADSLLPHRYRRACQGQSKVHDAVQNYAHPVQHRSIRTPNSTKQPKAHSTTKAPHSIVKAPSYTKPSIAGDSADRKFQGRYIFGEMSAAPSHGNHENKILWQHQPSKLNISHARRHQEKLDGLCGY